MVWELDVLPNFTDHHRLLEPRRVQCWLQSLDDFSCNPQCGAELFLILPPAYCMHGVWSGQTQFGQDHDLRSLPCWRTFYFRTDLLRCEFNNYSRACWLVQRTFSGFSELTQRRSSRSVRHPAIGRNTHSILRLDFELTKFDNERSQ